MKIIFVSGVLFPIETILAGLYKGQAVLAIIGIFVEELVAPPFLVSYAVHFATDQIIIVGDLLEAITILVHQVIHAGNAAGAATKILQERIYVAVDIISIECAMIVIGGIPRPEMVFVADRDELQDATTPGSRINMYEKDGQRKLVYSTMNELFDENDQINFQKIIEKNKVPILLPE